MLKSRCGDMMRNLFKADNFRQINNIADTAVISAKSKLFS